MGEAAALTAALSWAFASTAVASLSGRLPPIGLSALQTSFASAVLISAMLLTGNLADLLRADVITLLAVAGSGVVGFAIGEPVYVRALAIVGMQRTYPVTIGLFILFTTVGGVLILGERLTLGLLGGGTLILAGAYLIVMSRERTSPQAAHPPQAPGVGGWGRPGTALAPVAVRRTFRDFEGYALLVTVPILWTVASLWVAGARGALGAVPRAALRDAMSAVEDFPGLTGSLSCQEESPHAGDCATGEALAIFQLSAAEVHDGDWPPPVVWTASMAASG